jgi:hypothetical protein
MAELVATTKFNRAFRRLVGKNPTLQYHIEATLRRLERLHKTCSFTRGAICGRVWVDASHFIAGA